MYDASEIGLDWQGTLSTLANLQSKKCSYLSIDGKIKTHTGTTRCRLTIEDTLADGTFGKLNWAKRRTGSEDSVDVLVKKPAAQTQGMQETVIQWLCYTSLQKYGLSLHCPKVYDLFTYKGSYWFTMEPIYSAPILMTHLSTLPTWKHSKVENGIAILKILAQIAMCCCVLESDIGFNHRDLKPDNILVRQEMVRAHTVSLGDLQITVAASPTAVLVDFGFACLGPGTRPWIQSGGTILSPLDSCPKTGRDLFMILVFLLWCDEVRQSLTPEHLQFFKESLQLTRERWSQMMSAVRNPKDWIYMVITDKDFQCPALDAYTWLSSCSTTFPEVVSIKVQSGSKIVAKS